MTTNTALFSPESTRLVLESACRVAGMSPRGASLVRLGENALYYLHDDDVMGRVGRSVDAARKEVNIAKWLQSYDFPAARLVEGYEQPILVEDTPVTFWERIHEGDSPVTSMDLGRALRRLHALPVPEDFELPRFSPVPKVVARLAKLPDELLAPSDKEFLRSRSEEVGAEFASLQYVLPPGPVHGDAHTGNLMRTLDGTVRLIDFEDFCTGPREWDLIAVAVSYRLLHWMGEPEYQAFVEAYGFDLTVWPGFETMCAARELNMTTWLAQQLGMSSEIDVEVRRRIADLRDDNSARCWRIY